MNRIYLDDVRTPVEGNWIVVRNYQEFVDKVNELGLDTYNVDQLIKNSSFSSSTKGLNLTIGYELGLRTFTIVPTLDLKFISLKVLFHIFK